VRSSTASAVSCLLLLKPLLGDRRQLLRCRLEPAGVATCAGGTPASKGPRRWPSALHH